jgi:hypothetical protein
MVRRSVPPSSQVVAAGLPERVGMHVLEAGALGGRPDQVVDRLARQRLAALGDEQPGSLSVRVVR